MKMLVRHFDILAAISDKKTIWVNVEVLVICVISNLEIPLSLFLSTGPVGRIFLIWTEPGKLFPPAVSTMILYTSFVLFVFSRIIVIFLRLFKKNIISCSICCWTDFA